MDITEQNNEPLSELDMILLQIGNLTVPRSNDWTFCISGMDHDDCFATESPRVKSMIVSIPSLGNYSMKAFNDATSGFLETGEGISIVSVASNRSFIKECHFVPDATAIATVAASPTIPKTISSSLSPTAPFTVTYVNGETGTIADSASFRETIAFSASQLFIPISENSTSELSGAVIAGAVVASMGFLIIGISGVWWVLKRCGRRRGYQGMSSAQPPKPTSPNGTQMTFLDWDVLPSEKRGD
jgi:hypothetical protein